MCCFHNISRIGLLALTALVLGATPATANAETPADRLAPTAPAPTAEPAVSTSPAPTLAAEASLDRSIRPSGEAPPPLTRAATRQRIETMSPMDWLASYGDVRVGRTR